MMDWIVIQIYIYVLLLQHYETKSLISDTNKFMILLVYTFAQDSFFRRASGLLFLPHPHCQLK